MGRSGFDLQIEQPRERGEAALYWADWDFEALFRDEGTSHHYLPPGRTVEPARELTAHLAATLRTCGCVS